MIRKNAGSARRAAVKRSRDAIAEKAKEALFSVLPLIAVVALLCLTISPVRSDLMLLFGCATLLVVLGMGLFSLGADRAMTRIGESVGTAITRSRSLPLILIISFALGFAVTAAEPDLQVLAETVPHVGNIVLVATVGLGVGFFLALSMLRILTGVKLKYLLLGFYALIFILAAFTDAGFLGVSFDAGGVTTGPMTVPFILALGVGVSKIRSDGRAEADSFGLVALCSIGPVLAVMILGFFTKNGSAVQTAGEAMRFETTADIFKAYLSAFPTYAAETAFALLPVAAIFLIFQFVSLHMSWREISKIFIGIVYTYVGLVLFLVGVNVGFSSLGTVMGGELATGWTRYLLIPLAMALGWFIISAEPAVAVLEKQVESVSAGAIPGKAIKYSMSIGVALAMGLSMLRVLFEIPVMYILLPGYIAALALSFFVPDIYTAIAFDSGGVASGPLTATFMLQFVIGTASALDRDLLANAFGVVALVAMMPLISIQAVGLIYGRKKKAPRANETPGDFEIIELWEVGS